MKASRVKARDISKKLGFKHCEIVDAIGFRGGLWVAWNNDDIKVSIMETNEQFIHTMIERGSDKIFVTTVYACPNILIRRSLWPLLRRINPGNEWPWFIRGDFNATLYSNERQSSALRTTSIDCDFYKWVEEMELTDMGCVGPYFTWKREGCESRIDRVLANAKAQSTFIDAVVKHLPWFKSNRCPLLLQLWPGMVPRSSTSRPFRFNAPWVLHDDFNRLVKDSWEHKVNWVENIEKFIKVLVDWSNTSSLEQLQRKLWFELEEVILQEDLLWAQKAKCDWYTLGDKNSKFFHTHVNDRRRRNKIEAILQENGE
ncbi:uncharacterized protein LOC114756247 [Neltuma alba]|uniref:uncharacterized protein LOC114756247 n=1 Tax=Neltuma alba TaxID=207710 RepID=UPI0010A4CEB2|nr:uncharacterized protein LOC114756247 [Prosopis alba]